MENKQETRPADLRPQAAGAGTAAPAGRYASFDGLRAAAALGIAAMHYEANLDAGVRASLVAEGPFLYGVLIPCCTQLVFLFFMLSALSMCCGYFTHFAVGTDGRSRFDVARFYDRRYARVWPFFALLVALDVALNPSAEEVYEAVADLTLAFNLLPNPDIHVIGVGWFLGTVFVFYMLFPWFAYLLQDRRRAWLAMGVSVVLHVLVAYYFLSDRFVLPSQAQGGRQNIVFSFPFLMAGGLLYLYRTQLGRAQLRRVWLVGASTATAVVTVLLPAPRGAEVLWFGVPAALWVMYVLAGGRLMGLMDGRIARFLGGLSMEIYLSHMLVFRAIECLHPERWVGDGSPQVLYWGWYAVGMALTVAFCYGVKHRLFPLLAARVRWLAFLR